MLTNGVDSSHRNSTPISVNNPILVNRVSDGAPVSSSSSKLFGVVDDDDDTALATTTAAAISSSSNSITSSAADSLSDSAAVDAHNKIPKPIKAMAPRLTTRGRLNTIDLAPEQQQWLSVVEDMLIDMMSVSRFIREVICEIVLRDLEHLTARYMRKMRKSFSRMHWDDDGENPEQDMS